jgi:cytochrome c peroxidase
MVLPKQLAAARGNRYGDSQAAAALGFHMFFDARFSSDLAVRCATCHAPENAFQDAKAVPVIRGLALPRNTPTMLNAARMSWIFWDGRADSLWSQPLIPLENPLEMNFTRLEVAHQIAAYYAAMWSDAYGPLPDISDPSRFPARGKPGMPAWDAMAQADRDTIDDIFAKVGKAFEAYLRILAAGRSDFDRHLSGESSKFAAGRGLAVFLRAGCAQCHSGPLFTDEQFHDLGLPPPAGGAADPGRADAAEPLAASPFTAYGPHWDGPPPPDDPRYHQFPARAFRTPSLRNLSAGAPYGHDGRFATLEDAIAFHLQGGGRGLPGVSDGEVDPLLQPQTVSATDAVALAAFLRSLEGDYPPPPWNNWPDK